MRSSAPHATRGLPLFPALALRTAALLPLLSLLAGCLAPGERDPTRYPWDARKKVAAAPAPPAPPVVARGGIAPASSWKVRPALVPPEGSYCIMAIEQERQTGISVSANSAVMACSVPANTAPNSTPK